jgi:hypothetical protein
VDDQVRLQLFVLAYNLGNFLRQAVLHWTLTTLRAKLIKIGAKVVRHSRICNSDTGEGALEMPAGGRLACPGQPKNSFL